MATVLPDFDVQTAELAALAAEEDERMTMALRIAGNGDEFVEGRGARKTTDPSGR
jgi:hypothetical protein